MKFTVATFVAMAAVVAASPQAPPAPPQQPPQVPAPGPAPGDNTGLQMFSEVEIKAPCGACLASAQGGRVRLLPCDQSASQKWNIVTSPGQDARESFIINSETNECLNFERQRDAGRSVTLVNCGGAEAQGVFPAGNRDQFPLNGQSVTLEPVSSRNQCVRVNGDTLDKSRCSDDNDNQLFTMNA